MQTTTCLVNYEQYGPYIDFVKNPTGPFEINVKDITVDNYFDHLHGIYAIILDGIDEDIISQKHITVNFGVMKVNLSTIDYWYSLIMWYALIVTDMEIQPAHIFFDHKSLTQSTIKNFIDSYVIPYNRKRISTVELNLVINKCLESFKAVDEFSFFLMNTINLKDDIDLMNANPEYYDLLHADFSNIPLEDVKKYSTDLTERGIEIIKRSGEWLPYEHCLADSFRAKQGINIRQYKEFNYHIGPKPRGDGDVWPESINTSFTNGGVGDPLYYMIDSSAGRTAQMMSKINVGDSGAFARLLGLNNIDTYLHPDQHYDCCTQNYEVVTIRTADTLNLLIGRYYRSNPRGMEYCISASDTGLIGRTIYLRSPMTCASKARGEGICYKCYGDLAYTNNNINIGKMAADILSSELTQRLLSARHLLETVIIKIKWAEFFDNVFEVEGNGVKILSDINTKEWTLVIDPDTIESENEYDYSDDDGDEGGVQQGSMYNEYVTQFEIFNKRGEHHILNTDTEDKLYITAELNAAIRSRGKPVEDKIHVPLAALEDSYLFFIAIHNNELSKTMQRLMDIINKNAITTSMNKDQILQAFLDTVIEGGLYITGIHCEVILSNQLRSIENIQDSPLWQYADEPYQVVTLNTALTKNPSVIISLMYQRLSRVLYDPLTFRKKGASFLDLFFFENVTEQLSPDNVLPAKPKDPDEKVLIIPMTRVPEVDDDMCID